MVYDLPDYYIFDADVYCEECTEAIKKELKDKGFRPIHYKDETTFDSNEWPKGPYSGEESDSPQHCGNHSYCLNPLILDRNPFCLECKQPSVYVKHNNRYYCQHCNEPVDIVKYGAFLKGSLTTDGIKYIKEQEDSPIVRFWKKEFDIE